MNNVKGNWRTTIFGILMLVMRCLKRPGSGLRERSGRDALIGGAGLIAVKDGNKTGVAVAAASEPVAPV